MLTMYGNIKNEILQLTEYLEELCRTSHTLSGKISEIQSRLSVINAWHVLAIAREKDEKGKNVYPNDATRCSVLTLRLHEDQGYQKYMKELRRLSDKRDDLQLQMVTITVRRSLLWMELGQPPSIYPASRPTNEPANFYG